VGNARITLDDVSNVFGGDLLLTNTGDNAVFIQGQDLIIGKSDLVGGVQLAALTYLTINGAVNIFGTADLMADADGNGVGVFSVTPTGSITTNHHLLDITAADTNIAGSVDSGTATTTMTASSHVDIALGSATGAMNIADAELSQINSDTLLIKALAGLNVADVDNSSIDHLVLDATSDKASVRFDGDSTFTTLTVTADDGVTVAGKVNTSVGAINVESNADQAADSNDRLVLAAGGALNSQAELVLDASNSVILVTGDASLSAADKLISINNQVEGAGSLTVDSGTAETHFNDVVTALGADNTSALILNSSGKTVFGSAVETDAGMSAVGDVEFLSDVNLGGSTGSDFSGSVVVGRAMHAAGGSVFRQGLTYVGADVVNISSATGVLDFQGAIDSNGQSIVLAGGNGGVVLGTAMTIDGNATISGQNISVASLNTSGNTSISGTNVDVGGLNVAKNTGISGTNVSIGTVDTSGVTSVSGSKVSVTSLESVGGDINIDINGGTLSLGKVHTGSDINLDLGRGGLVTGDGSLPVDPNINAQHLTVSGEGLVGSQNQTKTVSVKISDVTFADRGVTLTVLGDEGTKAGPGTFNDAAAVVRDAGRGQSTISAQARFIDPAVFDLTIDFVGVIGDGVKMLDEEVEE